MLLFRSDYLTNDAPLLRRLLVSLYFGLATFGVALLNTFIFRVAISNQREQNWKAKHEIGLYVIHFFTISISVFFLTYLIAEQSAALSITGFLRSVLSTIFVGSIPVSIHVISEQKRLFKKNFELAAQLNPGLKDRPAQGRLPEMDLNGKSVSLNDLLYAESDRNYIKLVMNNGNTDLVRMPIKQLESLLQDTPNLVRCHRAFIVNTNWIENVEGNAQGLRLYLHHRAAFVPVSRSYIPKVQHLIHS